MKKSLSLASCCCCWFEQTLLTGVHCNLCLMSIVNRSGVHVSAPRGFLHCPMASGNSWIDRFRVQIAASSAREKIIRIASISSLFALSLAVLLRSSPRISSHLPLADNRRIRCYFRATQWTCFCFSMKSTRQTRVFSSSLRLGSFLFYCFFFSLRFFCPQNCSSSRQTHKALVRIESIHFLFLSVCVFERAFQIQLANASRKALRHVMKRKHRNNSSSDTLSPSTSSESSIIVVSSAWEERPLLFNLLSSDRILIFPLSLIH